MGKTVFNRKWLATYSWLRECKKDNRSAFCCVCDKTFTLGTMGESALKTHMAGSKHKQNERATSGNSGISMRDFMFQKKTDDVPKSSGEVEITGEKDRVENAPSFSKQSSVSDFSVGTEVLKSEILWTLKTISDHGSYRANEKVGSIFQHMFPDSKIAAKFSCGERKTAYLGVFGLAPYFLESMKKKISGKYVVLFDESLNKKNQMKQMDMHVRYWSEENSVSTSYLGSQFMGHGTASAMLEHFMQGMDDSGLKIKGKLQQVSMDGPNVNWAFFKNLQKELGDNYEWSLLNLGSCGLHTVHNSFKAGASASGWQIDQFLSSLYYLFKDSPARRDDFIEITHASIMPLKFANHRWLENVPVCNRAISILSYVKEYVDAVSTKKLKTPTCKSYSVVSECVSDKLIRPKLQFFKFCAGHLQPFLAVFQTDRPMVPFLGGDLSDTVRGIMRCFINHEKLNTTSDDKLQAMLEDKKNKVSYKKVDLGFVTEKELKEATKCHSLSERQVMEFRMEACAFLEAIVKKILLKSPLNYSLVRNLSCFNPQKMASKPDDCRTKFRKVISSFASFDRIKEDSCDTVIREYNLFLDDIQTIGSHNFLNFKYQSEQERLDTFLYPYLSSDKYANLLDIFKIVCVLSHGQATVERGFSVNKEIEVENMKQQTLVAQRIICDNVRAAGGVMNVAVTPQMMNSCKLARQRYDQYLATQREEKKTDQERKKRKLELDNLDDLKRKRQRIENDISSLTTSSEEYAEKAEATGKITFVTKSNSLRRTAKEKGQELKEVEEKVNKILQSLKENSVK